MSFVIFWFGVILFRKKMDVFILSFLSLSHCVADACAELMEVNHDEEVVDTERFKHISGDGGSHAGFHAARRTGGR